MSRIRRIGISAAVWWLAALALAAVLAAGCAVQPVSTPAVAEPDDEAQTMAFVRKAIDFYEQNGLDATVARYNNVDSIEDGRALLLIDAEEAVVLTSAFRNLVGQFVGPGATFNMVQRIETATAEGSWRTSQGTNPETGENEPRRRVVVLHDGLVFSASHSLLRENVAAVTQAYVRQAIEYYQREGLDATIAYYNSGASVEDQFYLFLIGADDIYLAHPIFPHLIGTDIKDVVGSDGQELGKEIAQATEDGIWVEYLWPHPVTRFEQHKVAWAQRHDGMIFASGYYTGAPGLEQPAWRGADPQEYTVAYVERAIERYKEGGLEALLNYYNSVASFEGQWYLFATDADDIYIVHPLLSQLIGTDIKNVVGNDGYELGKELAKATEGEGVWVEYLWPHPVNLKEAPKVGYAVRYDGLLFASGYYVEVDDPAARTKEYVQEAIAYYEENSLDATVKHYNSEESFDGQWNLSLYDENNVTLVAPVLTRTLGLSIEVLVLRNGREIGKEIVAAAETGGWVSYPVPNARTSELLFAHQWAIRHDGLIFSSRYYNDQPDVAE